LMSVTPGDDQRTRIVTVTQRGKEVLSQAFPLWEKAQARVVKGLGLDRWKSLRTNLEEVVSQAMKR